MGTCFSKTEKKSTAEITPCEYVKTIPTIKLYGSPDSLLTSYIRFALLQKPVTLQFLPSETQNFGSDTPVLQVESESVSGSRETLIQYIESKFPHPPLVKASETTPLVAVFSALQHRSVTWHLGRMMRWVEDLRTRGGRRNVDPGLGSPRMEVKKFAKSYSRLLEVMVEHSQMEERVLFPILESADRGLCKGANEGHARQLPIMNGIKEEIKSIVVMDSGSRDYHEALSNLSSRLKLLREHCRKQFAEEEKDVLPLMEAVELSKEQEEKTLQRCVEVMQGTHSHLFGFLLEGLLPHEAMQYLDLMITKCEIKDRLASMLGNVVDK